MTKQPRSDICSLSLSLESFTFLGGRMEREALPGMEEDVNPLEGSAFPLAQAQVGDHLCIAWLQGRRPYDATPEPFGILPWCSSAGD